MGLLDGLTTTVHAAFGLFKMRAAYSGPAIRVKDSTATEADIGFDANGNLNTAALSGYSPYKIVKWYDQSGGGRDWANATGSGEPTLDLTENALRFDNKLLNVTDLSALTQAEIFVYRKIDNDPTTPGDGYGGMWSMGIYSGDSDYIPSSNGLVYDAFGSTTQRQLISHSGSMTAYHIYSTYSKASDWANYLNGTQLYQTSTNTVSFRSTPTFGRSQYGLVAVMTGHVRSVVLFSAKVTGGERTTFSSGASYVAWPTITTPSPLPNGTSGSNYSQALAVTGGTGSITWSKTSGSTGWSVNSSTGAVTATAPAAGTYTVVARATDSVGNYDEKAFSITIVDPLLPTDTKWGHMIPRSNIQVWLQNDTANAANNLAPDYSGYDRHARSAATNAAVRTANVLNGESAWKFNGTSTVPLSWTGAITLKHIFVVASYDDATFTTNSRGLLSDVGATAYGLLVGASGDTKWVDFDATYVSTYRKSDVVFAHASQTAAMSGTFAIYELVIPAGVTLAGIQIGKDRNNAAYIWKGYFNELLAYSDVKNDLQRLQIYQYFAMRYWLWQKNSAGLDVFPFASDWSRTMVEAKSVLSSRSVSGVVKQRYKTSTAKREVDLGFSDRRPVEVNSAREFHRQHYGVKTFLYRDFTQDPNVDFEAYFMSPIESSPLGYQRGSYRFTIAEK